MIDIKRKEDCVGCGACHDVCPVKAIDWRTDIEGFWYPEVNLDTCVNCGLCEKVCPVIHADELNRTNISQPAPEVLAAHNADREIQFKSTSGGIFQALASKWLEDGGYIGGAVWTEGFGVRHILSNRREDLPRIMGSKYLQSDMTGLFKEALALLKKGEKVLICGCPCQMAGMRRFLRKEWPNLLLVDFICCSINSPKLFKSYIKDLEQSHGSTIAVYHPKNKEYGGWHRFAFKATFDNGAVYHRNGTDDEFTRCFIGTHVAGRPSCFECRFKKIPRVADISLGDFWGIEKVDPSFDSPNGISVVLLNNPKGKAFYHSLGDRVVNRPETLEDAVKDNPHLLHSASRPSVDRGKFYEELDKSGFRKAMDMYGKPRVSMVRRILRFPVRLLRRIVKPR